MQSLQTVDLSRYDNSAFDPGRPFLVRLLWFLAGLPLLRCALIPSSACRIALLRAFGAEIGEGCVLQQHFTVKYPWHLKVGRNCWFGENCWIDNLVDVTAGDNVCISQGAYLCTGNHNWSDPAFALIVQSIRLGNGSWVGARASLAPGVVLGDSAIAAFGSVVMKSIPAFEVHAGNPAVFVRRRQFKNDVNASTIDRAHEPNLASAVR